MEDTLFNDNSRYVVRRQITDYLSDGQPGFVAGIEAGFAKREFAELPRAVKSRVFVKFPGVPSGSPSGGPPPIRARRAQMTSAVIFDLYQTLIYLARDVNPYLRLYRSVDCLSRVRESMVVNAPSLADFCGYLGVQPPNNLAELQADLEADIASAAMFPDALPTLQMLRRGGIRVAVISNLATPYKAPFFELGLDSLVDAVIFSCDIRIAKPDPRIYRAALNELGVDADAAMMVGDSQKSDVDGPRDCGIRSFLIDRTAGGRDESSLRELSEIATQIGS